MDLNLSNTILMGAAVATFVCLLIVWYVYFSSWSVLDQQNNRSLHVGKTLTGAGLLMFLPISILAILLFPSVLPIYVILVLTLIGFIDDRYDISFQFRLLIQIASALLTLYYFSLMTPVWLVVFLVLGLIWWVNLFNFMDGANGMAALHGLICLLFYGVYFSSEAVLEPFVAYLLLSGYLVIAVYLVFNMKLKNLFMGDSGSLPMAWIIAIMAIYGLASGALSYAQIAVLHAVFITDATLTLFLRIKNGENVTQAHASHLYQRLIKFGYSHNQVSFGYAAITAANGSLVLLQKEQPWMLQILTFLLVYLILMALFMKYLNLAR